MKCLKFPRGGLHCQILCVLALFVFLSASLSAQESQSVSASGSPTTQTAQPGLLFQLPLETSKKLAYLLNEIDNYANDWSIRWQSAIDWIALAQKQLALAQSLSAEGSKKQSDLETLVSQLKSSQALSEKNLALARDDVADAQHATNKVENEKALWKLVGLSAVGALIGKLAFGDIGMYIGAGAGFAFSFGIK